MRFVRARRGAFAISLALLAIPLIIALGIGIDYIRAYNATDRLQGDLDGALLASVKDYNTLTDDGLTKSVKTWFGAQVETPSYTLTSLTITRSSYTVSATAGGAVPTTFMAAFGISSLPISATSAALGPGTYYVNVYLLLDTSASEDLAADTAGQGTMRTNINCEFGCHTGDAHTVNGVSYTNNNDYASAAGITERNAVLISAAKGVINAINAVDPNHTRIKVGVYFLNTDTTEILPPTLNTSGAVTALASSTSTSVDGTHFDTSLATMANKYTGISGDGKTADNPLKFVMLVTDGVQSERDWVARTCTKKKGSSCTYTMDPISQNVAPLDPAWCNNVKNKGVTMSVLYTTYLPVPLDWGYNGTLGSPMPDTWTGTLDKGVSPTISRHDYLPYALKDCASTASLYMEASASADITTAMTALFQKYENIIRLVK